jgi:endonuclease YncB( thermonuclease family)
MKPRELLGWLIAAGLLVAVVLAYLPRDTGIAGAVRIVDGDGLYVGGTEVRLFGVDAFEGRQVCVRDGDPWPCGESARDELRALTEGRAVTCIKKDTDRYKRAVSVCSNGTVDLGAELTRAGLALAYREFSDDYIDEEDEARTARRGAWAGEFKAPWDERNGRDTTVEPQPGEDNSVTSSCRGTGIKGNINSRGERIYHVPESSSYEETKIDESKGERWFCTKDDAEREGWRPPHG